MDLAESVIKLFEVGDSKEGEDIRDKLVKFFKDNPNPSDSKLHDFADSIGIDPDEVEKYVYQLISGLLAKGKSYKNKVTPDKVDPKELAMGLEVEKEHTDDPDLTQKIALDHLAEIPDYYTRLDKMEKEAKGVKESSSEIDSLMLKYSDLMSQIDNMTSNGDAEGLKVALDKLDKNLALIKQSRDDVVKKLSNVSGKYN